MDPDQNKCFISSFLGTNCLQRLSADDKSQQTRKENYDSRRGKHLLTFFWSVKTNQASYFLWIKVSSPICDTKNGIKLFFPKMSFAENLGRIFMLQLLSAEWIFYFKISFFNCFRNTYRVSNSLDPDQDQYSICPDPGSNCLQRLSADDKSHC